MEEWFLNNCNNVECDDAEFEIVYPITMEFVSGNEIVTVVVQSGNAQFFKRAILWRLITCLKKTNIFKRHLNYFFLT